jgi:hypothetical protein
MNGPEDQIPASGRNALCAQDFKEAGSPEGTDAIGDFAGYMSRAVVLSLLPPLVLLSRFSLAPALPWGK